MMRIFLFFIISGVSMAFHIAKHGTSTISKKHVTLEESIFIKNAPYVAAIESKDAFNRQRLSVAIIITTHFLIATRTIYTLDKTKIKVVTGTTDLDESKNTNKYDVESITCPLYNSRREPKLDLCLIKLKGVICFDEFQKPIALLKKEDLKYESSLTGLKIVGYGRKNMPHPEPYDCMGDLKKKDLMIDSSEINFDQQHFMLKTGEFSCTGDIGTPAIWKNRLAGLVIDGPLCEENENKKICNKATYAGIIHCFDWIVSEIGEGNLQNAANFSYRESHV